MSKMTSSAAFNAAVATAAFKTIQTDAGTYPVATSATDTLTLTSPDGSVTITGNSATDTVSLVAAVTIGSTVITGFSNAPLYLDSTQQLRTNSLFRYYDTRGMLSLGTTNARAQLHLAGNISSTAWTTAGVGIRVDGATYLDTTSSGTVTSAGIHAFGIPTINSTNPAVYSVLSTVYVAGAPVASGSSTFAATPLSFWVDNGDTRLDGKLGTGGFGGGTASPTHNFGGANSVAASSWGANGVGLRFNSATYTDTTTADAATVTSAHIHAFLTPTISATNAGASGIIISNAAHVYINGAPNGNAPGGTIQITNPYSLWCNGGDVRIEARVGVGNSINARPSAFIHVAGSQGYTASWGANGPRFRLSNSVFTDSNATGTISTTVIDSFSAVTVTAGSTATYTHLTTAYIGNTPNLSSNASATNNYALWLDQSNLRVDGQFGVGSAMNAAPATVIQVNGSLTASAWGTSGIRQRNNAGTFTDSSSSGTVSTATMIDSFLQSTIAASSGVTINNAYSMYVAGPPIAGSNVNIQDAWTAWFNSGYVRMSTGAAIGGGQTLPLATLDIAGSMGVKVRSIATSASLLVTDNVLNITNTSAARTVMLPGASFCFSANSCGHFFQVKDGSGTAAVNNITVQINGSATADRIDGTTFSVINTAYGAKTFIATSNSTWGVF